MSSKLEEERLSARLTDDDAVLVDILRGCAAEERSNSAPIRAKRERTGRTGEVVCKERVDGLERRSASFAAAPSRSVAALTLLRVDLQAGAEEMVSSDTARERVGRTKLPVTSCVAARKIQSAPSLSASSEGARGPRWTTHIVDRHLHLKVLVGGEGVQVFRVDKLAGRHLGLRGDDAHRDGVTRAGLREGK